MFGASNRAGLERIARRANGWLPFGLPLDEIAHGWTEILEMAERTGRDPHQLQLVFRTDPRIDGRQAGHNRASFMGSCSEVIGDIEQLRELGAIAMILDFYATARSTDELVDSALCLTEPTLLAA